MAKVKTKNSKFKLWFSVIVLGVIVLFGVLILSRYYQTQKRHLSSRYITYHDPSNKFSIDYPEAWDIRKDTQVFENGDVVAFRKTGPSQKKYTELFDGAQLAISKPFVIDSDLATWMKSYYKSQAKFSKLPLNNYEFEVVEACGYMECMKYYFTKTNDQVYGIALYADGSSAEKASYENALLYMLKSFRFTNAKTGTVSEEEAISKVKSLPEVTDYLKRVPNGLVLVNGGDDNTYFVQVYEFKDGHTATFNWYNVFKATGVVQKQF